ncbi:MAG: AAA family ATPase [Anaerolineae bacterium]|nr:AAA family ATPase [Anaerolineae bacterium]
MIEQDTLLEKIEIANFLSLRHVEMPLKKLTVLVGPNASGKSNSLRALELLKKMMYAENPPELDDIQSFMWAGRADNISFNLSVNVNKVSTRYNIELAATEKGALIEELFVDNIKVIAVNNGNGKVCNEDGTEITDYRSAKPKLALKSAGDYGNKPITRALTEFIRGWEFYDFEPNLMRGGNIFSRVFRGSQEGRKYLVEAPKLDDDGSTLQDILLFWARNDPNRFESVNQALEGCTKLGIEQRGTNGDVELYLREGYQNPIPLRKASDGTIRLVAYYALLNMPNIPTLIAIEEPERNLHPAALKEIANVLEHLANRTQVIITTHSSQLLDAFEPTSLSNELSILLLRNSPGSGTEVLNLTKACKERESLNGWIEDFGIGSAIFNSGLFQEVN